jgi:hypothetical protein
MDILYGYSDGIANSIVRVSLFFSSVMLNSTYFKFVIFSENAT